jgi:hypothetical protein
MRLSNLFATKPLQMLLDEMAGEHRLRRVLGAGSLTALGIRCVIGAGIFVVTGMAAHSLAGPALGVGMCLLLMLSLPASNWLRLIVWLAIGFVIYFSYGRRHSILAKLRAGTLTEQELAEARLAQAECDLHGEGEE